MELRIKGLEEEIQRFKKLDPLFDNESGVENDPIVLDEEVEAACPCSSCLKESYVGPVHLG